MRIENSANSIKPRLTQAQSTAAATPRANHAPGGDPARSLSAVDVKSIDNLLNLIASSSEIRESVVNDVKMKIQTGEYLAKQSAVETAGAILNL
jgi:anti-sigma28 factor (negative regulator of flagellin synthesis)